MGDSPQDGKKSDTTELLIHTHTHTLHTRQPAGEEERAAWISFGISCLTEEKEARS